MNQDILLKLFSEKNDKAYNLMYDMYSRSLYAIINNIIRNDDESEDVLQETFIKIWKNFTQYDSSKGRFYTWILNIARNTAYDKLKSKSFNQSLQNQDSNNFVNLIEDNTNTNYKLDSIGIKEFIKKLKPKCIEIINLLFFKGYTQQETSEELKMPLGSVKTLNRSCINDLRTYLNESWRVKNL